MKNSDSTSGNAQEQLPKFLLVLSLWESIFTKIAFGTSVEFLSIVIFYIFIFVFALILHRNLFDWKPNMYSGYTREHFAEPDKSISDKVIVIVIDGMRKERFYEANTPFLDYLKDNGTEYLNMETVYPARTVVCFSSMFTGTYPMEHGIHSNMVWKLGIKVESVFDSLRRLAKRLLDAPIWLIRWGVTLKPLQQLCIMTRLTLL